MSDPDAWIRLCAVDDLPPRGLISASLPDGTRLCVVSRDGVVHVLVDRCPHRGMPLSSGDLLPDGLLQCSWHGATFDVVTGKCWRGPSTDDALTVTSKIDGQIVYVMPR